MLKHILMNGDSARHLIKAISRCSRQDIVLIFSGFIRLWLEGAIKQKIYDADASNFHENRPTFWESMKVPIDTDKSFCGREKIRLYKKVLFVDNAVYNIIEFCIKAASYNVIRQAMLEAGVLSLVLAAFASADFQPSGLMAALGDRRREQWTRTGPESSSHSSFFLPIPLAAINSDAATLTAYSSLKDYWSAEQIRMRQSLGLSLLDVLLSNPADIDEKYLWTRELFRKILIPTLPARNEYTIYRNDLRPII